MYVSWHETWALVDGCVKLGQHQNGLRSLPLSSTFVGAHETIYNYITPPQFAAQSLCKLHPFLPLLLSIWLPITTLKTGKLADPET